MFTANDGGDLYYETAGSGETVAFVGEAGYGAWQWGWQHRHVTGPFESLVWDMRGTGQSDSPSGPCDVRTLAADLEAVLAAADCRRVHLVGAGLGGMVALRYAREYGRARSLALFGTAPTGDAVDADAVRALHAPPGDEDALRESLAGAFSAEFLDGQAETVQRICEWRQEEDADVAGFEAQRAAMLSFDGGPLHELTLPTLVCHGRADPVVSVETGEKLAGNLPRGEFEPVEGRHLCFVEHSRPVSDRLLGFLDDQRE